MSKSQPRSKRLFVLPGRGAHHSGYSVVGVASGMLAELARSLVLVSFVDCSSSEVLSTLIGLVRL